jgi:hypothetical protein
MRFFATLRMTGTKGPLRMIWGKRLAMTQSDTYCSPEPAFDIIWMFFITNVLLSSYQETEP